MTGDDKVGDDKVGDNKLQAERAALQGILDAFGGDPARWPAAAKARFVPVLAQDSAARAAVAEARALDSVLSRAPRVAAAREAALLDRIMAEATAETAGCDGVVIAMTRSRGGDARPTGAMLPARRASWQAAALLAASLMIGVLGGASGLLGTSLDAVGAMTGLYGDSDTLTAALSQAVEIGAEEEAL